MPLRRLTLAAVLLPLASACAAAGPVEPPPIPAAGRYPFRTAQFDSNITWAARPPIRMRLWISADGVLEEIRQDGQVSHLLRAGGTTYAWTEGKKEGVEATGSQGKGVGGLPDAARALDLTRTALLPANRTWLGREKIAGYGTLHYRYRWFDPLLHAYHEGEIWVLEDRAFPVRLLDRDPIGGGYQIDNTRLIFDADLPRVYFLPPSDVQFMPLTGARPHLP